MEGFTNNTLPNSFELKDNSIMTTNLQILKCGMVQHNWPSLTSYSEVNQRHQALGMRKKQSQAADI